MSATGHQRDALRMLPQTATGRPVEPERPAALWGRSSRRAGQGVRRTSVTLMGGGSIPARLGLPHRGEDLNALSCQPVDALRFLLRSGAPAARTGAPFMERHMTPPKA